MQLPDGLENRRFSEWNYLIRGLMEVWELARKHGIERQLEDWLLEDETGMLTEFLGRLGYVCSSVAGLYAGAWILQDALTLPTGIGGVSGDFAVVASPINSERLCESLQSKTASSPIPYVTMQWIKSYPN